MKIKNKTEKRTVEKDKTNKLQTSQSLIPTSLCRHGILENEEEFFSNNKEKLQFSNLCERKKELLKEYRQYGRKDIYLFPLWCFDHGTSLFKFQRNITTFRD